MRTLCRLLRIVLLGLATATPSYAAVQVIAVGGQGGETFVEPPSGAHVRIAAVVVHAGSWVDSLQVLYQVADGQRMLSSRRGGSGGVAHVFTLEPDERIVAISGRYGQYVHSLRIHTDRRVSPEYGTAAGTPYRIDVPPGHTVAGFAGRSGVYLDAVGLMLTTPTLTAVGRLNRPGSSVVGNAGAQPAAPAESARATLSGPVRIKSNVQADRARSDATFSFDLSKPAGVELTVGHGNPGAGKCYPSNHRPVARWSAQQASARHSVRIANLESAGFYYYAIRIGGAVCETGNFGTATIID